VRAVLFDIDGALVVRPVRVITGLVRKAAKNDRNCADLVIMAAGAGRGARAAGRVGDGVHVLCAAGHGDPTR
jgi:hypothetical protein